jgi:hypothetical protein
MPAPVAAYVLAVVGTVAAGIAFKEVGAFSSFIQSVQSWS